MQKPDYFALKPSDIPDDIWESSYPFDTQQSIVEQRARAVLAEREACRAHQGKPSTAYDLHERIYEARRVMNNLTTELEALDGIAKSGPAEDVLDSWAAEIQRELDALPVNNELPIIKLLDAGQALWDINQASREIRRLRELLNDKA